MVAHWTRFTKSLDYTGNRTEIEIVLFFGSQASYYGFISSADRMYVGLQYGHTWGLSPDLARDFLYEVNLSPLLFFGELVADLARGETALGAE